jgi:hypothetical protein
MQNLTKPSATVSVNLSMHRSATLLERAFVHPACDLITASPDPIGGVNIPQGSKSL